MSNRIPPESFGGFRGRIGVAREDITPPVGIYARNWGAAAHDVAEGVHRPLTATVLAIQDTETGRRGDSGIPESPRLPVSVSPPLLLCSLDLGWWRTAEDEWALRGSLLHELNLDSSRLLLCLSHTHAGPTLSRQDAGKPGGHLVGPYLDSLRESVLRAIRRAVDSAAPASLIWAYGSCELAHNRDRPEGDRTVCGYNPDVPADDTLLVGRVISESGDVLAAIISYACHPTTLAWQNRLISPDYVGVMREVVEAQTGAPCLFLQGASGELGPREGYTGDTAIADSNGRKLGYAVLSALEGMLPPGETLEYAGAVESGAVLGTWQRVPYAISAALGAVESSVELTLKPLESAEEVERQIGLCDDRVMLERLNRRLNIRRGLGDGDEARTPFWAWRMGDALILAHPNEAYSELQQELRARFHARPLAVINVTNGPYVGYLPTTESYRQNTYQAWQTPFAEGCLERAVQAAGDALARLLVPALPLDERTANRHSERSEESPDLRKVPHSGGDSSLRSE